MASNKEMAQEAVQKSDELFAAERKEDINVLIIVGIIFILSLLIPNQFVHFFKDVLYFV